MQHTQQRGSIFPLNCLVEENLYKAIGSVLMERWQCSRLKCQEIWSQQFTLLACTLSTYLRFFLYILLQFHEKESISASSNLWGVNTQLMTGTLVWRISCKHYSTIKHSLRPVPVTSKNYLSIEEQFCGISLQPLGICVVIILSEFTTNLVKHPDQWKTLENLKSGH